MSLKKNTVTRFAKLTWDDFEKWAGSTIASRGLRYQQDCRVSELATTKDGCLIAWVQGSDMYATKVGFNNTGSPESTCTCPYEFNCKHGVAVVQEFIERTKALETVPEAGEDNEILHEIEAVFSGADNDDLVAKEKIEKDIGNHVRAKTKEQLIELILESARCYPQLYHSILEDKQLHTGNIPALASGLRKEIRETSSEPGWWNPWRREGYIPDYSSIRNKLTNLLEANYPDEVLALGQELMAKGAKQVECSDDEGETAGEVSSCIPIIVQALILSSLTPEDKLERAVDALLDDKYDLFYAFDGYLTRNHLAKTWSTVADRLLKRLDTFPPSDKTNSVSVNYRRDQLVNWIVSALENAGRSDEILPLCRTEAKETASYTRLVRLLIKEREWEEAERWIREGIRVVNDNWPGIAQELRSLLRNVYRERQDAAAVAALLADDFVQYPSAPSFLDCVNATDSVQKSAVVRECLMTFLEKGVKPAKQTIWPLPSIDLGIPMKLHRKDFPLYNVLIDIAMYEKKPDIVLRWYDEASKQRYGGYFYSGERIAEAIKDYAPDRALDIWRKIAESLIAQVKPSAYEKALSFLSDMKKLMIQHNKQKQWSEYLQHLRITHARKRRLMEILDVMDS